MDKLDARRKKLAAAQSEGRRLLAVAGEEQDAFKFLEATVQQFPQDPEIRLLYATSLIPGRPDDVAVEAAKAAELGHDDPAILVGAGHRLIFAGRRDAARSCADRANELAQPGFFLRASLFNLNGVLSAFEGDDERAEKELCSAVKSDPTNASFAGDLAVFMAERGRLREGAEVLDDALKHVEEKDEIERMRARMAAEAADS